MVFVLQLKSPLRQGNTVYPFLVIQFRKDAETDIKIKLKPEQIKETYGENLNEEYSGPAYDIFTKIFKVIVGIGIIIPGGFQRYKIYKYIYLFHYIKVYKMKGSAILYILYNVRVLVKTTFLIS
jgi:hypothetical protein